MRFLAYMERYERQRLFCRMVRSCEFDADRMARFFQISVRQLGRYFHQDFGRPAQDFLDEQRMIDAIHLLAERESVKEVSVFLGYSRADSFARAFRRVHGLTPREFLRKRRKHSPDVRLCV